MNRRHKMSGLAAIIIFLIISIFVFAWCDASREDTNESADIEYILNELEQLKEDRDIIVDDMNILSRDLTPLLNEINDSLNEITNELNYLIRRIEILEEE